MLFFLKSREFKDIRYDAYNDKYNDQDKDDDKDKDKYMGLSLLCGKIYRTVKYQYFGWFEEPIIKIEVLEYV